MSKGSYLDLDIVLEKKETISAGYCAKLLSVSPRTIGKWCDHGKLKAVRLPSTTQSKGPRRVAILDLVEFVRQNNLTMPKKLEEYLTPKVSVCYGLDSVDTVRSKCLEIPTLIALGRYLTEQSLDRIKLAVIGDCFGVSHTREAVLAIREHSVHSTIYYTSESELDLPALYLPKPINWGSLCDILGT